MPPAKNRFYDFLRRHYPHQVIGSKFVYFLSACTYKLPCIYFLSFYIHSPENTIGFLKKALLRAKKKRYPVIHPSIANFSFASPVCRIWENR